MSPSPGDMLIVTDEWWVKCGSRLPRFRYRILYLSISKKNKSDWEGIGFKETYVTHFNPKAFELLTDIFT